MRHPLATQSSQAVVGIGEVFEEARFSFQDLDRHNMPPYWRFGAQRCATRRANRGTAHPGGAEMGRAWYEHGFEQRERPQCSGGPLVITFSHRRQ